MSSCKDQSKSSCPKVTISCNGKPMTCEISDTSGLTVPCGGNIILDIKLTCCCCCKPCCPGGGDGDNKPKPPIPERETVSYGAWAIQSHAGDVQYHWIKPSGDKEYASVEAPEDPKLPGDLIDVWDFKDNNRLMDISAKYELPSLAVGTKYEIVMIVLLKTDATGWRLPLNVTLPDGGKTAIVIPEDLRRDSWEKVVIGDFTVIKEGEAQFEITDSDSAQLKDGLFLRGFELRPL